MSPCPPDCKRDHWPCDAQPWIVGYHVNPDTCELEQTIDRDALERYVKEDDK